MSDNKKYYWLKLKDDFFDDETIKFIEEQENGIKYSNFYLKLCLKSIKTEGKLIRLVGDTLIPYDITSLSSLTGVDFDTVKSAMELFTKIGLVKILETGEIYLNQIDEMIGSETDKAKLMRRLRAKEKLEGNNVTQMLPKCYPEIEKEKDIEKDIEIDIKESKKERKENQKSFNEIIESYTDNIDLQNELKNHLKVRKQKKGSLTNRAIELELNTLDKLTSNVYEKIDIVKQSIEKGWIGFFALKEKRTESEEEHLERLRKVIEGE